jgi:sortase A
VRLRDLIRDLDRDPLLKVGVWAMVLALGFAVVVTVGASLDRPMEIAAANTATSEPDSATVPLVRTDPGIDPWVERDIPPPKVPAGPAPPAVAPQSVSAPKTTEQPQAQPRQQKAATLTGNNDPLRAQTNPANYVRHYLPPGAIMALTIPSLGLRNAPVMDSVTTSALDQGVVHLPDTSLPWSDTPERNVYLAGHRLGWPGTGSHLIFYRLNELTGGERVTLRARDGTRYNYRVIEAFTVRPDENWVTGRIRGRDLLTLQTCTPIPTFEKRLIVRAERV